MIFLNGPLTVYSELMHIHPASELRKALSDASLSTDDSFNCDAGRVTTFRVEKVGKQSEPAADSHNYQRF